MTNRPILLALLLLVPTDIASQEADSTPPVPVENQSAAESPDSTRADFESDQADSAAGLPESPDTVRVATSQAERILDELHQLADSLLALEILVQTGSDEDLELGRVRAVVLLGRAHELERELLELLPALEAVGLPTDSLRSAFGEGLAAEFDLYQRAIERFAGRLADLRSDRNGATPEELPDIEARVNTAEAQIDDLLGGQFQTLVGADDVDLDASEEWESLENFLSERAGNLVGRLQLAVDDRTRIRGQLRDATRAGAADSELATLRARLQLIDQRVAARADNLTSISELLEQRGQETSQYRQFVIRATGEVTSDILDPEVLWGLAKELATDMSDWLRQRGPTWFVRGLIVLTFVVLFRVLFRGAWWGIRLMRKVRISKLLGDLGSRMVGPIATIAGLLAGLAFIGVNPTHLLAGMGVAGVIVGLALQDSMSNLAAGFFILVYEPYDVDDVVTAGGVVGKVRAMGLANTTIVTFDNRRMHVPNRKIWQEVIENRSTERVRRAEATVRVGYEHEVDRAIEVIRQVLAEYDAILVKPEPSVFASRWADSWIEITVWGWAANADWWTATTDLPRLIRNGFDAEGIEIPLPRRQIVEGEVEGAAKSADPPAAKGRPQG